MNQEPDEMAPTIVAERAHQVDPVLGQQPDPGALVVHDGPPQLAAHQSSRRG